MPNKMKIRLLMLGKKNVDLLHELHKIEKYRTLCASTLSDTLNDVRRSPQSNELRIECDKLIRQWEEKRK